MRELYDQDIADGGYVQNLTQLFSLRPEVYRAWRGLVTAIKANMDVRRYELATIAAASAMRCSYCVIAHGAVLASGFFTPQQVVELADDFYNAGPRTGRRRDHGVRAEGGPECLQGHRG